MGDTPHPLPATLSCFSILAFVFLFPSSTTALSHSYCPSPLLQSFYAHKLLIASAPPTGSITSSGITSQDGADANMQPSRTHLSKKAVVGIVAAATVVLGSILLCLLLFCLYQNHASNTQSSITKSQTQTDKSADQKSWSRALISLRQAISRAKGSGNSACAVEYDLLKAATDNFSTNNLVGIGGSGCVYKARLDDGVFAAVKQLKQSPTTKLQLQREFQTEVELMSKMRHPNLVALLGYSINNENHTHLLVYELMLNGSLEDHLHGPSRGSVLNWNLRMKVALDAARGLEHLHEQCNPPIIHRDFKSSNILLDVSFNAKVSDFGLAILSSDILGNSSVELQGTFGYVPPEYFLDGILSEKSDVYAFGVVLLELITGRKPIDTSMPIGSQSLVTWAAPHLAERTKLMELLDPTLQKESVDLKHLHQVAAIAALCVQSEPSYRPLMTDVVNSLVPLVPSELGGAMRSVAEPQRRMMRVMMMMEAERRSPSTPEADASAKSLSFSEHSRHCDFNDPSVYCQLGWHKQSWG